MSIHLLARTVCALLIGVTGAYGAAPTSAPAAHSPRRRIISTAPAPQRVANPIPGMSAQQQALARIKEIFAADYADTSFNGRRALARRLIAASAETRRDSDAKYVFLSEARDVAASAGDVTCAFDAVDRLSETFPVVKLQERTAVLRQAIPILNTPQSNLAAVSICMDLVDQSIVDSDYARAEELLQLASDATRAARSVPHAKWIESRTAALRPLKAAYDVARPAEIALARAPGDPQANLVMGQFVAFVTGDFDAGLAMLIKSSDHDLASLADRDLDNPDSPSAQFALAGQWWDLSTAQSEAFRVGMRRRAGFWYRKAVPSLDGLDRALAERRLLELSPPPGVHGATNRPLRPPDALNLGRHYYRVSVAEVTWDKARELCEQAGGQLVSVETRAEGDLMIKFARSRSLWLGASLDSDLRWSWPSGTPMFYTNWAAQEPASLLPELHPQTTASGTWRATTGKAGFICEWSESVGKPE